METTTPLPHFDVLDGGNVQTPQSILMKDFITSRMNEIEIITQLIETPSSNIILKHKFPKHMRRRAMSQNIKRVPKRLQQHLLETKQRDNEGNVAKNNRRPRKKHKNKIIEYIRRQKSSNIVWLETHIWHAKRYHMVTQWGYKLPFCSNDKNYRYCYRATIKKCLIQDISYYCCIEISGLQNEIIEGLDKHMNMLCDYHFKNSNIQSGNYEGNFMFFSSGKYPFGAIGEVSYIWKPTTDPDFSYTTNKRFLWLWVHPSYYNEIYEELLKTFSLEQEIVEGDVEEGTEEMEIDEVEKGNIEMKKLELRNIPFAKTPKYISTTNSIKMVLLKDTLCRFRLTGPASQTIISSTFKELDLTKRSVTDWCSSYQDKKEINEHQLEFWDKFLNLSEPGQLPPRLILGLTVIDPRLTLATSKGIPNSEFTEQIVETFENVENDISHSPIWSSDVRDEVALKKLSCQQVDLLRSGKSVPGLNVELDNNRINDFPAIPCLFIQRPGTTTAGRRYGYGCGFDVIVPGSFGSAVWQGLRMNGGKPGGFKETKSILREAGQLYLAPDTSAGKSEDERETNELVDEYFRYPPAKRINYIKFGFPSPFNRPWDVLLRDWNSDEKFFVLRNKSKLCKLQNQLKKKEKNVFNFEETDSPALIGITLSLIGKGLITNNACICIPTENDLSGFLKQKCLVEEYHKDHLENERKTLRENHQKELNRLNRKRHKERLQNIPVESKSDAAVTEYNERMSELWLPKCTTVKDHCSRTVIGFVTSGDYCLTIGKSSAVGYVCLLGLLRWHSTVNSLPKRFVLVRNIDSNKYKFAKIDVISS